VAQRVWCWFDRARRYQVVSIPLIILVFIEGRHLHSRMKNDSIPFFVKARFAAGNTKQFTK